MSGSGPIEHPTWLTSGDFTEADEPLRLFTAWFEEASRREPRDPTAMSLATVDADGLPNVRMVLMKGFDERGFVFFTNVDSQKGRELDSDRKARCCFTGNRSTARCGCAGRWNGSKTPRPTPISRRARASPRSAPGPASSRRRSRAAMPSRRRSRCYAAKFRIGTVPRPPHWTGYRLQPLVIEFWQDRPFRLHDRIEFRREAPGAPWRKTRLYP